MKKAYYWNTMASIINALEAVIMSAVVTRTTSLYDAGILTISFAVGNLLLTIGKYGVRSYHATDVKEEYMFYDYFSHRLISCTIMSISLVAYCLCRIYIYSDSLYKVCCIGGIGVIYIIEAFEDVIWGEFQRNNRIDIGAKLFVFRWVGIIITFIISISIIKNMAMALSICALVSLVLCITYCIIGKEKYKELRIIEVAQKSIKRWEIGISLMKETSPLFICMFLTFYINNCVKYSLNGVVTEEEQACYGFVSMPVFVIGLLNSMIYQPFMVRLAEEWTGKNITLFKKRIIRQIIIIILISSVCILGAALVGIPILSVIYNTNLKEYRFELIALQVAGMFLAISGFLNAILTIMRKQKIILAGYMIVSFVAFICIPISVAVNGVRGACIGYLLCMILLCIMFCIFYYASLHQNNNVK